MSDVTVPTITVPVGSTGWDYAGWRPTVAQLIGQAFVVRYLCKRPNGKAVSVSEIVVIHAAGAAFIPVWEQGAGDWTQGAILGRQHGELAVPYAQSLGYPTGLPILFAYDTNVAAADHRAEAYGNAAADAVEAAGYKFGVYSDLDVMRMLRGRSVLNWLAGARAWSAPGPYYKPELQPDYDLVHVRQIISGSTPSYDNNVVLRPFEAWYPHTVTIQSHQEDEMPAIVTNSDAFDDAEGHHEPETVKWEYFHGTKTHISFEYWNGLGAPEGQARPYGEISAVPDAASGGSATGTTTLHLIGTVDMRSAV